MSLEVWVIVLGVVLMLADFFVAARTPAVPGLRWPSPRSGLLLITNLGDGTTGTAFNGAFVEDALAIFFKRFFLDRRDAGAVHVGGIFRPHRRRHQ